MRGLGLGLGLGPARKAGVGGWHVTNPSGLARWRAALANAASVPPSLWFVGDSTTWGVGTDGTGNVTTEDTARLYSYPAKFQTLIANRLGAAEAGFIASIGAASDSLVAVANTSTITSLGLAGFARAISSTGPGTITFTLPACTSFEVITWESDGSASNPLTGNYTYNVDAAGAISVPYASNAAAYRATLVTGLANTAHTVVLTGTTGASVYVMGIRYKTATGAMIGRFGRPGWTSNDLLGKGVLNSVSAAGQVRLLKSFGMASPALVVLSIGHNDCANQLTQSTTVANYKTNLQNIADEVTADGGCMLLLSQPLPPYAEPATGSLYSDYWQAADEVALAKTHVAHVNINDLSEWRGATNPIASGLQNSGSVHPTIAGYADIATRVGGII